MGLCDPRGHLSCHPSQAQPCRDSAGDGHRLRPSLAERLLAAAIASPSREHFQLCLTHQIRNLQGLIEQRPHLRWAQQMQALLREAIHLGKRRAVLTPRGFQRRRTYLQHTLEHLLRRPIRARPAHALHYRFQKYRAGLLHFLFDARVPFQNSACESTLRPSVIHRKVTGGFRSLWGAPGYAAFTSVIDTARLQGQNLIRGLGQPNGQTRLTLSDCSKR